MAGLLRARAGLTWRAGDLVPHHTVACFGCGPGNDRGLSLRFIIGREPGTLGCATRLGKYAAGGPGIAHGGIIAAIHDDTLGACMVVNLTPAMTKTLTVEYVAPLLLDLECDISGRIESATDREVVATSSISQRGRVTSTARGLFRIVPTDHFNEIAQTRPTPPTHD